MPTPQDGMGVSRQLNLVHGNPGLNIMSASCDDLRTIFRFVTDPRHAQDNLAICPSMLACVSKSWRDTAEPKLWVPWFQRWCGTGLSQYLRVRGPDCFSAARNAYERRPINGCTLRPWCEMLEQATAVLGSDSNYTDDDSDYYSKTTTGYALPASGLAVHMVQDLRIDSDGELRNNNLTMLISWPTKVPHELTPVLTVESEFDPGGTIRNANLVAALGNSLGLPSEWSPTLVVQSLLCCGALNGYFDGFTSTYDFENFACCFEVVAPYVGEEDTSSRGRMGKEDFESEIEYFKQAIETPLTPAMLNEHPYTNALIDVTNHGPPSHQAGCAPYSGPWTAMKTLSAEVGLVLQSHGGFHVGQRVQLCGPKVVAPRLGQKGNIIQFGQLTGKFEVHLDGGDCVTVRLDGTRTAMKPSSWY